MNVAVLYRHAQRHGTRASFLGDGILERARSTSLALLGATAALGLAIVALALNQSWPLLPGSPIPGLGERQAAVGDAAIAARAIAGGGNGPRGTAVSRRPARSDDNAGRGNSGGQVAAGGSPGGDGIVSHSVQVVAPAADSPSGATPTPAPDGASPAAAPVAASAEPGAAPVAVPASAAPQSTQPQAPSQSAVDPAAGEARERGHHYGRPESPAHGRRRGATDAEEAESSGDVEPSPSLPVAADPEPGEEGDDEAPSPSSSRGGHGHGHW